MDLDSAYPVLDTAYNAFISMDLEGRISYWNPRAAESFGYSCWRPTASSREITISALREGDAWSFHAFVQDISERVAVERERDELFARVEALARTDALTGLPNRRAWDEELRRELARASRGKHGLTVALVDLDHFKIYNDTYGHQAGDALLRDLGAAWRTMLRVTDLVALYGGEEFAVLLAECSSGHARQILQRMCEAMPSGQTFSVGFASWDRKESVEGLFHRADAALYEAKAAGRNRFVEA